MQDLDDFFTDDIVFDDQTLALLDEQEQKYVSQTQAAPSRDSPPPKRQRTTYGGGSRRYGTSFVDDWEDMPEISVRSDGTYKIFGQSQGETAQLAELRRQVEELQNANNKLNTDLQEVTDSKFAKEGEVSILRKGIEKTAQDHAAQVTRLKAAKEEADAKQIQIQMEMKEEVERLRTQFTFKQHELETSMNRGSWSVRSNKINANPQTPSLVQSQFQGWNQPDVTDVGPSKPTFGDSPLPRFGMHGKESAYKRHPNSEDLKPVMLPGFQNAFVPSSPEKVRAKRSDKGKARETDERTLTEDPAFEFQLPGGSHFQESTPSSPVQAGGIEGTDSEITIAISSRSQPIHYLPLELHRIILTHCYPTYLSPTLQILMGATLSSNVQADAYRTACGKVLDALSSAPRSCSTESALCSSLLAIAEILNANGSIFPLTALMNLLSCLVLSLPSFCHSLLYESQGGVLPGQSRSRIVQLLCDIVRDHLTPPKPPKRDYAPDIEKLGEETLSFLDVLCWNTPDQHAEKLSWIPLSHEMLLTMLDASQPSWLLCRSARILVFLATHATLYRYLLSFPEPNNAPANNESKKMPYVDRLCSYLVDAKRQNEEVESVKTSALTFVALLSIAHADALFNLLEAQTLIPSLVIFLTHMTTPIWEDDESLMSSPAVVASSTRTVNQTLLLLHRLVFSANPVFDLRHKLIHAPFRQFNGITHMFIVTLGRLSYADPPDWVDGSTKLELERLADMARDLLELVVEGPEGDSVWDVYQGGDAESETGDHEEEEREAGLLVVNGV